MIILTKFYEDMIKMVEFFLVGNFGKCIIFYYPVFIKTMAFCLFSTMPHAVSIVYEICLVNCKWFHIISLRLILSNILQNHFRGALNCDTVTNLKRKHFHKHFRLSRIAKIVVQGASEKTDNLSIIIYYAKGVRFF